MQHRVQKLLSNYGYCSRREAEKLIEQGMVKVNNKIISLGDKASEQDTIMVKGHKVTKKEFVYYAFHKPVGYVTAAKDEHYPTIFSIVKTKERVIPIGRLDYNTSGLLLLTNDGDFANKVMHPRYELHKTYRVHLDKALEPKDGATLINGMDLDDGKTSPAKVILSKQKVIELTIHEGKNRIVRRMLKELGYRIKTLERIAIGPIHLGTLKPRTWRPLLSKEVRQLQKLTEKIKPRKQYKHKGVDKTYGNRRRNSTGKGNTRTNTRHGRTSKKN